LDADVVYLQFIKGDEGVDLAVDDDAGAFVYHEDVVKNNWV
tara:strand:- start:63 stop:185 length:123 start_codon:yes stop_codon:yes gene_type:complete